MPDPIERVVVVSDLHMGAANSRGIFTAQEELAGFIDHLAAAPERLDLVILGDALDSGAVDVTATVARCLRDCTHGSGATELSVHLHPDDLEIAQQKIAEFDELADRLTATRFVADARAARGVVRIETEAGRLKYDPRDVLQRISESVRRQVRA